MKGKIQMMPCGSSCHLQTVSQCGNTGDTHPSLQLNIVPNEKFESQLLMAKYNIICWLRCRQVVYFPLNLYRSLD